MGNAKVTKNLGSTLRPISGTYRRRIRALYLAKVSETSLNDARRKVLEDAIFDVEHELEHRSVGSGGSAHAQVASMRAVRNVLLDDVPVVLGGQSEPTTNPTYDILRWPVVEAMAARIAGGRRRRRLQLSEAA